MDEVSSLLNKFQGIIKVENILCIHQHKHWNPDSLFSECAPDLSDPMSAAAYAAEEVREAKDGFVRYYSDEEGIKN